MPTPESAKDRSPKAIDKLMSWTAHHHREPRCKSACRRLLALAEQSGNPRDKFKALSWNSIMSMFFGDPAAQLVFLALTRQHLEAHPAERERSIQVRPMLLRSAVPAMLEYPDNDRATLEAVLAESAQAGAEAGDADALILAPRLSVALWFNDLEEARRERLYLLGASLSASTGAPFCQSGLDLLTTELELRSDPSSAALDRAVERFEQPDACGNAAGCLHPPLARLLVVPLLAAGRWEDALRVAAHGRRALKEMNRWPLVVDVLVVIEALQGHFDEALSLADEVLRLSPGLLTPLVQLRLYAALVFLHERLRSQGVLRVRLRLPAVQLDLGERITRARDVSVDRALERLRPRVDALAEAFDERCADPWHVARLREEHELFEQVARDGALTRLSSGEGDAARVNQG